jgi:DNA-binding transcriptional ArsR family regulator
MPEFKKKSKPSEPKSEAIGAEESLVIEPRCAVCQHERRSAIDKVLALGTSFSEIQRIFDVDRRSVSNHAKKHLKYEEGAIRRIIERESEKLSENVENGVQGALARRVFLETALQKAMMDLVNGDTIIEPKDAINIVAALDKMDSEVSGITVEEIRLQFNAILQAISETIPVDLQGKLAERAKEIAEIDGYKLAAGLNSGKS